jgi:hypothetical protein
MLFAACYATLAIATYIDLLISAKTTAKIKSASPSKNRKQLNDEIVELEKMQKFSIIWPYVIYQLLNRK